ncbi:MAG: DNA internalization-related competence protein ComEC/Rec2 [Clostridiales bacterium]|nr:DNA internalization-related competence protein ComEC/Rec2 [Clostridiales bacterium]
MLPRINIKNINFLPDSLRSLSGRPLFWHVVSFIIGLAAGGILGLSLAAAAVFFLLSMLLFIPAFKKKFWLLLLAVSFALGLVWGKADWNAQAGIGVPVGETAVIYGMVTQTVMPDEEGFYSFTLKPREINGKKGRYSEVLVYAGDGRQVRYGQYVVVTGKVLKPTQYANDFAFDYEAYLKRKGIVAVIGAAYDGEIRFTGENSKNLLIMAVGTVQERLAQVLQRLPEGQSALVRGVVLGDKSDLRYEDRQILLKAGIMHAFAVSGLHVGYILSLGMLLLSPLGNNRPWLRVLLIGLLLVFYAFMVGWPPSVIRAVVMAMMVLLAAALKEKADSYTAIAVAAMFCLLPNPSLLYDAGFQLSFLAAFSIIFLMPLFRELFSFCGRFRDGFAVTFAASLGVMPLLAYYFYTLSLIGLLLSPLLVFLVGLAVIWGFCAAILSLFSVAVSAAFIYPAGFVMKAVLSISEWVASLPGSYLSVGVPSVAVIAVYYVLLLLLPRVTKAGGKLAALLLSVLMVMLLTMPFASSSPQRSLLPASERLEVTFVDVGQGDCILIVTPDKKVILIDAGGNMNNEGRIGEIVVLPYLQSRGINSIDLMISTHPHADHQDGLMTVLRYMPVKYCLFAEIFAGDALETAALAAGAEILYVKTGDFLTLSEGIYLQILHPPQNLRIKGDENEGSLVCRLVYGEISFLFTGDLDAAGVLEIEDMSARTTVLKLPHHGSIHSYSESFYERVSPTAAVVCVGGNNSFGHPAPKVADYFTERGIPFYRTDKHGGITFFTNGRILEVFTVK